MSSDERAMSELQADEVQSAAETSPARRRGVKRLGGGGGAALVVRDDSVERRQRNRQRFEERVLSLDGASGAAVRRTLEHQQSTSGLTQAQIVEVYTLELDMVAKNKVNVKNAFQCQLMEHLRSILADATFQQAGAALNAGAKIYAYRIDRVFQDAHKFNGALNRGNAKKRKGKDDEDDDEGSDADAQRRRGRRAKATKPTIETNERNLNLVKTELDYEDDALFRKVCSHFDEGGLTGLLLNHVSSTADGGHARLHSLADPEHVDAPPAQSAAVASDSIAGLLRAVVESPAESVCPSVADFAFTGWSAAADDAAEKAEQSAADESMRQLEMSEEYRAVLRDSDAAAFDELPDDSVDDVPPDAPTDGDAAPPLRRFPSRLAQQTALISHQPQEYTFFDQKKIQHFKGPRHWHMRKEEKTPATAAKRRRVGKAAKALIDFDEALDLNALFTRSDDPKRTTMLVRLRGQNDEQLAAAAKATLLPPALDYAYSKFSVLLTKPDLKVMRPFDGADSPVGGADANVPVYDYDNRADSSSFCADVTVTTATSQLADDGGGALDVTPQRQSSGGVDDTALLLSPHAKIDYAKHQKKIDARRLKQHMWHALSGRPTPAAPVPQADRPQIQGASTFGQLCGRLPNMLNEASRNDLSVPISFVIFLHMCNEHVLQLEQPDGLAMKDFTIRQG